MDCSFLLPWTEAGEEFGFKQVALSSSWPVSPQQGGFWVAFGDICSGVLSCGEGA